MVAPDDHQAAAACSTSSPAPRPRHRRLAVRAALHAGATALSLVETLFLAASVALLLPAGRLGDAADKVALFKIGMVAFALTSILTGFATSMPALLALRVVQGIASAAVQAAGPAIVADAVPPERRGKAFGITI